MSLLVDDHARVRTLTLDRPDALNAFNEALYDVTTEALLEAARDPGVAVVLLTGNGRAFSAGTDLLEMHRMSTDPSFERGTHDELLARRGRYYEMHTRQLGGGDVFGDGGAEPAGPDAPAPAAATDEGAVMRRLRSLKQ